MDRDLIVGMSVIYIVWTTAVLLSSSRLIYNHLGSYRVWHRLVREDRVKLALWAGIPLLMLYLVWTRVYVVGGIMFGYYISDFGLHQSVAALPVALTALALSLWWVCDRTFGSIRGDKLWCLIMWGGVGSGAVATFLSWWF